MKLKHWQCINKGNMDLIIRIKDMCTNRLLLTSTFLISYFSLFAQQVTLEDIWLKYKYYDRGFDHIEWANNDSSMFFIEEHDLGYSYIISQNTTTGLTEDTVFGKSSDLHIPFSDFMFSPDRKSLLLETEPEKLYRRSMKAFYLLYDRETKNLDTIFLEVKQFNPSFSPNSKQVAFTAENNLYSYDLNSKQTIQLTQDGKWNHILNGRCDWVYEEEFEFSKAYEWSADSKYLTYLQFDESQVKEYQMQVSF